MTKQEWSLMWDPKSSIAAINDNGRTSYRYSEWSWVLATLSEVAKTSVTDLAFDTQVDELPTITSKP